MASSMEVDFLNVNGGSFNPGIAFEVDIVENSGSTVLVPKRVIKRLQKAIENKNKSPASLEEIEVRLREADRRRQQFHEWLANKAKAKPKSSPSSSLSPDDHAGRLAAKLFAAEQKRLDLLTQEQLRLAKLHELRIAAKTEAYLRAEREREALGSKVECRVQQAESNRLAILEAEKQRRAITHERVAQYVVQRMILEGKDRERAEALRTAICQKISAAEEKRACILEAEKSRAKAIVLQARKVAKAVLKERELELRKKKENLEARLSRAKRQRAAYLQQRGGCRGSCHNHGQKMSKHGDRLCRKLTRCWRQFRRARRTTYALAEDFAACSINRLSLSSLPFDQLAATITSPATLRSVKALLTRIESRLLLSRSRQNNVGNVDHLLKRLSPVHRKNSAAGRTSRRSSKSGPQEAGNFPAKGKDGQTLEAREFDRYPARIFLCAYMIVGQPDAVFSSQGDREVALAEAAAKLLPEFETLVSIILDGPCCSSPQNSALEDLQTDQLATPPPPSYPKRPFSAQLIEFDNAWCSYLYHFVVWKIQDAQLLEEDLIRMACQLEVSMLQKCKMNPSDDRSALSHDFQVIQKQVLEDQKLLHDRILHLTGQAGVLKMEEALSIVRAQYDEAKQSGASLPSPFSYSSSVAISPPSVEEQQQMRHRPKVARSLFRSSFTPPSSSENSASESSEESTDLYVNPSEHLYKTDLTNEQIVNEMLHNPSWKFTEMNSRQLMQEGSIFSKEKQQNSIANIQAQIKSTMERAFWDSVSECLVRDPPDYDRIVSLVSEIRDDLASLSPGDWKKELMESLDLDILSQVLNSGRQDFEYLRKLLDYTLNIIVKLGAPVRDEDSKVAHQRLVESLSNAAISTDASPESSFKSALVEGLRFIFGQLQILKQDITNVRLRALASLVTSSAGVEYLQKAFAKRYALPLRPLTSTLGLPKIVSQKLPQTAKWISDTKFTLEQVKMEVEASLAALRATKTGRSSLAALSVPPSMCTGGRVAKVGPEKVVQSSSTVAGEEFVMTPWDSMHTIIRLGLLQIACSSEAAVEEALPETLMLNIKRLRGAQNDFQHIVVLITGLLLIRQELAKLNISGSRLEISIQKGFLQLDSLLGESAVTIPRIGAVLARVCSLDGDDSSSEVVLREELMTRVLEKSLKPDGDVFQRVSWAVKASLRGMLILSNGKEGFEVAECALSRVGGCSSIGHVSKLVSCLHTISTVSWKVHGDWYMLLDAAASQDTMIP